LGKAAGYLKRYLGRVKTPTTEIRMLYAQILYYQATSDQKVNQDLLKEARSAVEEALLSSIRPKDTTYTFLLAILQQQNDLEGSIDLFELILEQHPTKKDFWPALTGSYLQLASTHENDKAKARAYQIRAINATERAQTHGFMKTPADNWRLVSLYLLSDQFSKGTELLHAGLKNGSIESTPTNWKYLGDYYRQAHKELEAVNALQEAAKLFPKDGSFDVQIGEIYRGMERTKEMRDHYRRAIQKGNLDKPWNVYQLLAYAAVEMDDWDEALMAINKASEFPESKRDTQMAKLKEHIETTVKARAAAEEEKKKMEEEKKRTGASSQK
jgi:tetratricopeptide (TPR) repeat protein